MKKALSFLFCYFILSHAIFGKQWVVFCSEKSDTHAYIIFIKENLNSSGLVEQKVGFYPDKPFPFEEVLTSEGTIKDDSKATSNNYFIVEVDEKFYNLCWETRLEWDKEAYQVPLQDCLSFMRAVAANLKGQIKVPTGPYLLPMSYVKDLRKDNLITHNNSLKSYFDTKNNQSNANVAFTNYVSPDGAFQFLYPTAWENGDINDDVIKVQFYKNEEDNKSSNVLVAVNPVEGNDNVNNLLVDVKKEILSHDNTKIIALRSRNFQKYLGAYAEFISDNAVNNMLSIQWTIVVDKQYVTLLYQTNQSDSKLYKDIGSKIVNSFTVLPIHKKDNLSEKSFKINPKDVTLSSDKAFRWYDWNKAPEDLKIAAGYITTYKNTQTQKYETLKSEIENFESDCQIKIAAVDLNEDGICGLAVSYSGSVCCGSSGCMFELFDNGGVLSVDLRHTEGVNPGKDGVKANTGRYFPLKRYTYVPIDEAKAKGLFTYTTIKKRKPTINVNSLVGGATPEELGKVLLNAFKTNNKSLWTNCLYPKLEEIYTNDPDYRQNLTNQFDKVRNGLMQDGITQWMQVKFSRVTFQTYDKGQHAVDFKLEFTYKNNEFIGGIAIPSTQKYNGKYFVVTGVEDYGVIRNSRR